MALPEDIIIKVRQDFSDDDSLRVLQALKELQKEDSDLFNDRILRCLVVSALGRTGELDKAITLARLDWRDLIVAAEYKWGNRVRLLALPFGVCPDIEILQQWFTGRQLSIPWADDEKWTIGHSDVRELSLEDVRQSSEGGGSIQEPNLYLARLRFLCIQGSNEISASKAIEGNIYIYYRLNPCTNGFEFQKFGYDPKKLVKRGRW
jgi:hypothetical protein